MVCPHEREIILSLKIVDYLHVQADKPWYNYSCADPESFVRGGILLTMFFVVFFLVVEGIEDPNTTLSGPSSAHQRNTT